MSVNKTFFIFVWPNSVIRLMWNQDFGLWPAPVKGQTTLWGSIVEFVNKAFCGCGTLRQKPYFATGCHHECAARFVSRLEARLDRIVPRAGATPSLRTGRPNGSAYFVTDCP